MKASQNNPDVITSGSGDSCNEPGKLSRRARRRHRRRRARKNWAAAREAEAGCESAPRDDNRPIIESKRDVAMVNNLRSRYRRWVPSETAAEQVPREALEFAEAAKAANAGKDWLVYVKFYAELMRDNLRADQYDVQESRLNLAVSRHSKAQTPEADEDGEADITLGAEAFRESLTIEEMQETAEELQQLGLLGLILTGGEPSEAEQQAAENANDGKIDIFAGLSRRRNGSNGNGNGSH